MLCSKCGQDKNAKGFAMHQAMCKGEGGSVAVMDRPSSGMRSQRARRQFRAVTPLEQIKVFPNTKADDATGAWAYYLRDTGIEATIREVLVPYPNGGIPDTPDRKMRDKYGTNADYYRQRQARKGMQYVGPVLTEDGMRRMVAIILKNRPEAIAYAEDMLEQDQRDADTLPDPKERALSRRRMGLWQQRLEMLRQEINVSELLRELDEIARAQQLASIDPKLLRVMRNEITANMEAAMVKFRPPKGDSASAADTLASVEGAAFLNADED